MISAKRGAILIYVLGVLALLGVIVTQFLLEAGAKVRYRSQIAGRQDMEIVAGSVLEVVLGVIYEIKEIEEGTYAPEQGWGNPLVYGQFVEPKGYVVKVQVKDETRKISLYKDKEMLYIGNLMSEGGMSLVDVVNFRNELKRWLASEKKEKVELPTEKQPSKEKEKRKRLNSYIELSQIAGISQYLFDKEGNPNDLYAIFKDNVSWIHDKKVNINTASGILKSVLVKNEKLSAADKGKKYFTKMEELGLPEGVKGKELETVMGFESTVFDIRISVNRGGAAYYLNAIVDLGKEKKGSKYEILALTEDSDVID